MKNLCTTVVMVVLLSTPTCRGTAQDISIHKAKKDSSGFLIHEVQSAFQAGTTEIRVLLPDVTAKGQRYPAVFVLPVEAGKESRYGDGLLEIKKTGLHTRYKAVFVAPTFSHLPWYADHPKSDVIRQESYFLKVVVPFIDQNYPVQAGAAGHLL